MSVQVQFRRGNTTQHSTFTGAPGEITVDTSKNTVVVHDGATVGGRPLAPNTAFDVANAAFGSANNVAPQVAPAFNTANAAYTQANNAYDYANTLAGSGFFHSTITTFPTGNYGSGEAYTITLLDAFGVSLSNTYDCMDPSGRYVLIDLDM